MAQVLMCSMYKLCTTPENLNLSLSLKPSFNPFYLQQDEGEEHYCTKPIRKNTIHYIRNYCKSTPPKKKNK